MVVLEKETEHYPLPRAVHLDHEMMRLFQTAGVIDRVLPDMVATDGHLHVGADHGVIRYMGTVGKPKPFGWSNDYFFYQPEFEAHLRAAFADNGRIGFLTGAEFTSLSQDDNGVTVSYTQDGVQRSLTARWVIAADGSRSPVRKALGVKLDDLDFEEPWLVVDAEVEGPVTFPSLTGVPEGADLQRLSVMMCDPARPATVVPGRRNHRRWEFMLLPHEDDAEMMREENVAALVGAWMRQVPHKIVRAATYRFHGLVAEHWQVGRVFLAGDAAHQTPPFFGQGMCHGLRDVANLAWKMAAIVNDGADEAILATYQPERAPHVRGVIGAAVAAGRYICELDPAKAAARDANIRAQAAQKAGETAADLIPAISTGFIAAGTPAAGERFIQPILTDGRKAGGCSCGIAVPTRARLPPPTCPTMARSRHGSRRVGPKPCWCAPITACSAPARPPTCWPRAMRCSASGRRSRHEPDTRCSPDHRHHCAGRSARAQCQAARRDRA